MSRSVLHNIQLLRFVAAGGVLVSHAADLLIPRTSPIWSIEWNAGVDIFFIISGFIMVYLTRSCFGEPGAPRAFLLRRAVRVVPPYWLFTTLMLATALLFDSEVKNATLGASQIVTSYLFIPWPRGDGRINPLLSLGWTLNFEIFFYTAFAISLLFRRGLWFLAASFIVLVAIRPWIPKSLVALSFWSSPNILEFLVGIALALVYFRGIRLPSWGAAILVAVGLLMPLVLPTLDYGDYSRVIFLGTPAFFICAGLMLLPNPERPGPVRRALTLGGDASYALYLSHPFTINAALMLWRHFGLDLPWLALGVAMGSAVAAAILFYHFVERPMTTSLQRLVGAGPMSGAADVAP